MTPTSFAAMNDEAVRVAARLAGACLLIESARAYGLITGGPSVDVGRCEAALACARERGLAPTP